MGTHPHCAKVRSHARDMPVIYRVLKPRRPATCNGLGCAPINLHTTPGDCCAIYQTCRPSYAVYNKETPAPILRMPGFLLSWIQDFSIDLIHSRISLRDSSSSVLHFILCFLRSITIWSSDCNMTGSSKCIPSTSVRIFFSACFCNGVTTPPPFSSPPSSSSAS